MRLFEVLPEQLFQVFAGRNRRIYAEVLLLLNEQYHANRFGIQYDIMRDLTQELLETQAELGVIFEDEEDQEQQGPEGLAADPFRIKANALLRRLERLGWIQVEIRDNFRAFIVLPHYSSRLLALFQELCEARSVEYQRFAFITYQLLTGEEARTRPSFAVLEAERMTGQFLDELKILVNNMKHHMEQVAAKTSVQEVLSHHFEEYKTQIIDRSYHRLKTSDHVSRYRQRILATVRDWLRDRDWLATAVEDSLRNEFFQERETAVERLRAALLGIEEVYRGLDEVFYQIDLRHNQYLRASFDRARYLSQHSHGVDQCLAGILEALARQIEQGLPPEDLSPLSRLAALEHLATDSLYVQRHRRPPHQPEPLAILEITAALREELRRQNLQRLREAITREKVGAYVKERLRGRPAMSIEELAPKNMEEFLYLLYVYLYGYSGNAGYRLVKEGPNRILAIGGYRFYDRSIVADE
ncbi:MAG: DUF5716 family protein [Firmicutes bacterium]|nr:DUF5716 family protein [Bacillota bacterium]